MDGPLEWIAAIGTMLAAGLIAVDLGRKVTGFGFVLFCAVSVTWIVSGVINGTPPITVMNAILLLINGWGVWQYLINPKRRKVIERVEAYAEKVEQDIAREEEGGSPSPS